MSAILCSDSKSDDRRKKSWRDHLKGNIIRLYDAAVVGGKLAKDYLVSLGMPDAKVYCGYDVVDNDFFASKAAEVRAADTRLRETLGLPDNFFLVVSRFSPEKNLFRLLDAYAQYRRLSGTGAWSLVMVGGGPLDMALRRRAANLGCSGVVWAGYVAWNRLPVFYGLASGFILASTAESWGLVVNEAMASALPVLVSDRAGCRCELLRDGENGFLFDPCDFNQIANAMSRLSQLSQARREAMGRKSVEIISDWGPRRFADAVSMAIESARQGASPGLLANTLIRALTCTLARDVL